MFDRAIEIDGYRVRFRLSSWGGVASPSWGVYLPGWGLLAFGHRDSFRACYTAACRAIRAYHKHGNVNYTGQE
jgi:hypothetical protein